MHAPWKAARYEFKFCQHISDKFVTLSEAMVLAGPAASPPPLLNLQAVCNNAKAMDFAALAPNSAVCTAQSAEAAAMLQWLEQFAPMDR
jgi:hypothetical protein